MNPPAAPTHPSTPAIRTALSVNVNKVALVRNTRHLGIPSVARAALQCLEAGAQGITVHPRPDGRHIRSSDVYELAELLQSWPEAEFNIEGNPTQNLMDFIRQVRPQQATFVPDSEDQFTSDHGWSFPQDAQRLRPLIAECRSLGVRVSLFMDPLPEHMAAAKAVGADRIELYTGPWADAFAAGAPHSVLPAFVATAERARRAGLGVNAGHDLSQANLGPFLDALGRVDEVSIGHALIDEALYEGLETTVRRYVRIVERAAVA